MITSTDLMLSKMTRSASASDEGSTDVKIKTTSTNTKGIQAAPSLSMASVLAELLGQPALKKNTPQG